MEIRWRQRQVQAVVVFQSLMDLIINNLMVLD